MRDYAFKVHIPEAEFIQIDLFKKFPSHVYFLVARTGEFESSENVCFLYYERRTIGMRDDAIKVHLSEDMVIQIDFFKKFPSHVYFLVARSTESTSATMQIDFFKNFA